MTKTTLAPISAASVTRAASLVRVATNETQEAHAETKQTRAAGVDGQAQSPLPLA